MTAPYDAIVIGSGFGGAVTAARLAEAGYRVLVFERGRRWTPSEFPRRPGDAWRWSEDHPERHNGWLDLRIFRRMAVAQGAAVGGGSALYANASIRADPGTFAAGWPPEITYDELTPHDARVAQMLAVQPIPPGQWPPRTTLLREAAEAVGHGDRFRPLDLAVTFDPAWSPADRDARTPARSRRFMNAEGQEQGTCVHLGECAIGCPVLARNTLDLNYIPRAERHGAEVRPLHIVRAIQRAGDGYRVHADRIAGRRLVRTSERARIVVLAAGSLGSTELLLRSRDVYRTLPGLPRAIGYGWSANGDFLTVGINAGRTIAPTFGPTITSAVDFRDGTVTPESFLIEDGGFPEVLRLGGVFNHVMPWFSQGRDASDGRLVLRRRWPGVGRRRIWLRWDPARSRPTFAAIGAMHNRLARATGGLPIAPLSWSLVGYLATPHPLGGCRMGANPATSVVDHRGRVWGESNLYVADGAIVPRALAANPSRTIAALAERTAAIIVAEGR